MHCGRRNNKRGQAAREIVQDASFRSVTLEVRRLRVNLSLLRWRNERELLPETVIYCENDSLALRLDACLNRLGLPTMGAAAVSRAHPVLQVLPLCLSLCWDPVDPQVLLDFLTLPVNPIPKPVAMPLVEALPSSLDLVAQVGSSNRRVVQPRKGPRWKSAWTNCSWLMCAAGASRRADLLCRHSRRCGLVDRNGPQGERWPYSRTPRTTPGTLLAQALQAAAGTRRP